MVRSTRYFLVGVFVLVLPGCAATGGNSSAAIEPAVSGKASSAVIEPSTSGKIMVALIRDFSFSAVTHDITDEGRIVDCLTAAIRRERPSQQIVSFEDFRRVAFPQLSSASAPRSPEYLGLLLKDPIFRKRIAPLEIRYIVFIGGVTELRTVFSGGGCAVGPGAGVCAYYGEWDKNTRLAASVLDISGARPTREAEASAAGTDWFLFLIALPIGA